MAPDTSVLVAAFASWHGQHERAFAAIRRVNAMVAHCLIETYSVLTRLPAPHRMTPEVVTSYLERSFDGHPVFALSAIEQRRLVGECSTRGLAGGAIYDALIAATCVQSDLSLLTLDARARPTYSAFAAEHELLA
ncbi:MAG: PIN domain-containing protein [Deltaproteobacteria bacterium]|nr:PIN domain-containing protein [Deltaproteobacteria bacterium]